MSKIVYRDSSKSSWQFDKIIKFDGRIIELGNESGGTLFTVIPISPLSHRNTNPTNASIKIIEDESLTTFLIKDDWGKEYMIQIPNDMKEEIENAKNAIELEKLNYIKP